MNALGEIKQFLQEVKYPGSEDFGDDEVAELFSLENRFTLLAWLAKEINPKFLVPTEQSPQSLTLLANLFYSHGFCSLEETNCFVKGVLTKQTPKDYSEINVCIPSHFILASLYYGW